MWNCRLCNLPDLNQSVQFVSDKLIEWSVWYMNEFQFDGFRVDTVKHVAHEFWTDLRKKQPWYNIAEIFDVMNYSLIQSYTGPT